mgnify:CR=1 FL=1
MPPLAALGTAAIAAASTVTLTGLATGAAIISAGTGILSQITGSKTLGKISMGFGIASGAGFLTSGATSAIKGMRPSTSVGGKGLLDTNNIDDILKAPTKGTKAATDAGFKTFGTGGAESSSMNSIGGVTAPAAPTTFDPELEKSFFQRANDTLTKYNPLINIAAGVGQGYMQGQQMEQQERLFDKRLAQDQQLIDRTNVNNGTLVNLDPSLNLSRKPNPFPLLQRN